MSKLVFSGIQPTGLVHIGNYLGAIKQWVELQHEHESIFSIVDYHAITIPYEPAEMQKNIFEAAIFIPTFISPSIFLDHQACQVLF
ncbi:MAG: hypothetical protein ABFD64_06410 [Armatimonadota bacterium]